MTPTTAARTPTQASHHSGSCDVVSFRVRGWRGVGAAWIVEAIRDATWEALIHARSVEQLTFHARSEVHRIVDPSGATLYAKALRGLRKEAGRERFSERLKWALRPSRAKQVWRVQRRFEQRGLRCAPVALAARGGPWWSPVDVIITGEAPGRSLHRVLNDAPAEEALNACRGAGLALAALHRARLLHGDATPYNLFVDDANEELPPSQRFVWVDNDRTRAWPVLPLVFARRNVQQMALRIRRHGGAPYRAFLDGYCEGMGLRERERTSLKRYITMRVRERRLSGPRIPRTA